MVYVDCGGEAVFGDVVFEDAWAAVEAVEAVYEGEALRDVRVVADEGVYVWDLCACCGWFCDGPF